MEDRNERAQAYDRLKARVSALDMTMARFAVHVGTTASKASLWRSRGIPESVRHALATLERTKVASAIWTGRRGSTPKVVDAMDAMGRPFGAVIDDAVTAGWSHKRIAEVMRRLADDLDRVAGMDQRGDGRESATPADVVRPDEPDAVIRTMQMALEPYERPIRHPVGFGRDIARDDFAMLDTLDADKYLTDLLDMIMEDA